MARSAKLDTQGTKPLYSSTFLLTESEFSSPIAETVYGANGISWMPDDEARAKMIDDDLKYADYATRRVKTHLSQGVPRNWTPPIRDVLIYSGAIFLSPCAGNISLMPCTSSDPAFHRVDVDLKTGKVRRLFQ